MRAAAAASRGAGRGGRRRQRARRGPPPTTTEGPERLQKVLSRAGVASRREVEAWVRAGRLTVNGVVATLGTRVTPLDRLQLDGRRLHAHAPPGAAHVFIVHRSPGEALQGSAGEPGLLERLPRRAGRRFIAVSPMPRIDGGLELVTADGELAARLQRAVHALVSEFGVRLRGELSDLQLQEIMNGRLDSGVQLAVERCQAAGGEAANRWYTVAARGASGKDVRQLFERQGALVSRVLRTRLGALTLERSLRRGQFRQLAEHELRSLITPNEPLSPGR